MILNAYAVLDAFTSLLRLFLGLMVVYMGFSTWWNWKVSITSERRSFLEVRSYLLSLLAILLLILNVASWPLFYLLLQSYVSEWPGVMCIYGVTQIGSGSLGSSRFLPGLLTTLQVIKPALIFLTGAWFVLYLINRRTRTAPLMPRVLLAVILLGLLAVFDATIEGAYLIIPKKEEFLPSGCCTATMDPRSGVSSFFSGVLSDEVHGPWFYGCYYAVNIGMALALAAYILLSPLRQTGMRLAALCLGALISLPVNFVFLVAVAAPALLHLAHHHCLYDLVSAAPESMVAIALYVVGSFSVGWACLAGWFGNCTETRSFLTEVVDKILRLALCGYAGSVMMLSFELLVA